MLPSADRPGVPLVAVIPAYNEHRFIGSVVLEALEPVDRVIVVEDGSRDRTAAIARRAGVEVVEHTANQGKAQALVTGFARTRELHAQAVVTLDGDGQHNPREIPEVVSPILLGEADLVICSRFLGPHRQIPLWRRMGQRILTWLTSAGSGTHCSDSQSGFRAFGPRALEVLGFQSQGFAVDSEMQFWAREHSLRTVEMHIDCEHTQESKRNPVRQGMQVLNGILELVSQSRPLMIFGAVGLLLTLLGTGGWCWTVHVCDILSPLKRGASADR